MNINSAINFAKKNKKTLVFICAILVILVIILYLHYAYDLFGLKEHEFDEKVRENYEVDTKTLDNDSIQSLNNQYNNIQVSVHKPDNSNEDSAPSRVVRNRGLMVPNPNTNQQDNSNEQDSGFESGFPDGDGNFNENFINMNDNPISTRAIQGQPNVNRYIFNDNA